MRFLRLLIYVLIVLALVTLALANRQIVTLNLFPFDVPFLTVLNNQIELPLFLVILIGVLAGLLIGLIWEYLREAKYRRAMGQNARALKSAQRELQQIKRDASNDQDDIIALLDSR